MNTKNIILHLIAVSLLITIGVLGRLVPHMPNFTPIGAIALFGGAYLSGRWAIPAVFATMVASDFLLGYPFRIEVTTISIYASFAAITLIGMWLRGHKTISNTILSSVAGSVLFFLVTNASVWAEPGSWYPRGFEGLVQSWYMGLPFFRNTLMGDLFYTGGLFGSAALFAKVINKFSFSPALK